MGKGDRKSRKGKIWRGSFGNSRPRRKTVKAVTSRGTARKAKASKA